MARLSMNYTSRGFVLSFATFALALFLFLFAQAQYTHLLQLQLDAGDVSLQTRTGDFYQDVVRDFNILLGENIRVDQNEDTAIISVSGNIPTPLDVPTNFGRYTSHVRALGSDFNIRATMYNVTQDQNYVYGHTNTGLGWANDWSSNPSFTSIPYDSNHYPYRIDINIQADWDVEGDISGATIQQSTPTFDSNSVIYLHYSDVNASNTFDVNFALDNNSYAAYTFTYPAPDGNSYTKTMEIGVIHGHLPFTILLSGPSEVTWKYTVRHWLPNDENGTKAGYDLNTSIQGTDFNIDTNTIWVAGT